MIERVFIYEDPNSGKEAVIGLEEIEEIALERGDERRIEDMDDASFYRYCNIILDAEKRV